MAQLDWDRWFLEMAVHVATKSKDRSTKVGCVLVGQDNEVLSVGFNGFPRGVNDDVEERHERPLKYQFVEHAERNAVYNAARQGIKTLGCKAYLNCYSPPCQDCTRALIQPGLKEIITTDIPFPGLGAGVAYHVSDSSIAMLQEAEIMFRQVYGFKDGEE
jgi:dCMP deaminase